ncbi:MAG: sodium:calcium antiporter [Methanomassiliicoccales archaeon]|nr:MAG: sodium:calcium antiporter [Methanomassiliicoccales archaeon]
MMLLDIILLAGGLAIIYYGGRYLVEGASSLALLFGMPPIIIGVTVVAFGTSAPEFFLSMISAAQGVPGVSVGNVIGANVANVTLVIGICAVIAPIISMFDEVRRESYVAVMASCLFLIFAIDGKIVLWEGSILLLTFMAYIYWVLTSIRKCCVSKEVRTEYNEHTMVVTGSASLLSDLDLPKDTVLPGILFIIGLCLFLTAILRKRCGVTREAGYILLALYGAFIVGMVLLNP